METEGKRKRIGRYGVGCCCLTTAALKPNKATDVWSFIMRLIITAYCNITKMAKRDARLHFLTTHRYRNFVIKIQMPNLSTQQWRFYARIRENYGPISKPCIMQKIKGWIITGTSNKIHSL